MMTRSPRCCALGLAGALACGALACGERATEHEGEHVTLLIDWAVEPCGDTVGHMDRVVATLADYLGVSLAGVHFNFVWFSPERFAVEAGCGDWPDTCESGGWIRSTVAPVDSLLVRLVLALVGSPPPFFEWGAVQAFTPDAGGGYEVPDRGDVQHALSHGVASGALGGAFTRFLIDRHGLDAYLAFYANLGEEDSLPVIEAEHAEQFGESLTETIVVFDAERRSCPAHSFRFKLFECSAPPIAWDGDALLLRRSLACGDDDVVGRFDDDTARVLSTLEVVTAGTFEISLAAADEQAGLVLGGCGGCEDETEVRLVSGREPIRRWLPAGRYYLQLGGGADVATELALRFERVDEP